ncbi:MAG: N-acetylglucosamine-6-phosphate deacetylase [Paenibacillaceae bacterium]|nr:N-acetylglucosamine-6-phosphate deacetylase [Paenibacillaceae bacterium]
MSITLIRNVQIVTPNPPIQMGSVAIEDGKIKGILPMDAEPSNVDQIVEGHGRILIPGMIDVHINGAEGYDMMDGSARSVEEVSKSCARSGCTGFLATSVSSSIEDLLGMVAGVSRLIGREPGAFIAGIHMEGPYLHPKRKGMQNEKFLRHPDLAEMKQILDGAKGLIRMVTLAPELPGGMDLISMLLQEQIIVSIAHSDATYEEAMQAFALGASHVTHCFNGMRPIHHRDPGLVLAALEENHVSIQAIVDGVHLHPAIVRLMYREKGAEKMVLVTDAMQAMGLGDGEYVFGGHQVQVANGVARLQDGSLASSTVTMNEALKHTVHSGIPFHDAVLMATQTPADLLGLKHKGRIEEGADADLVLINSEFEVVWTMLGGKLFAG